MNDRAAPLGPVLPRDRIVALDALRGVGLLGVFLVNVLVDFRVSLFAYLRTFHTGSGRLDRLVDILVAVLVEQKAMVVFSLLFGVGLGMTLDRARARSVPAGRFVARRYGLLLALGLVHLLLVWSGDILAHYAVAALVVAPLARLRPWTLVILASVVLAWWASPHPPPGLPMPSEAAMDHLAEHASRAYGHGGAIEALRFRIEELRAGILPLLVSVFPRTLGLFLLGVAVHARVRRPPRRLLLAVAAVGVPGGLVLASLDVLVAEGRLDLGAARTSVGNASTLLLGLGYAGGFFLALEGGRARRLVAPFVPVGRMALTSYLAQTLVGVALFQGLGLGLMNRLGSAVAAGISLVVFAAQALLCRWWLARHRFGPVEGLWRRLSYGDRRDESPQGGAPPPSRQARVGSSFGSGASAGGRSSSGT